MDKDEPTQSADGAETNQTKESLVKVVVKNKDNAWKTPNENEIFYIDEEAKFPEIEFALDVEDGKECLWSWKIDWAAAPSGLRESPKRARIIKKWTQEGKNLRGSSSWVADLGENCMGGTLTVCAKVEAKTFRRSVRILGKNPSEETIKAYIATFDDIPGFANIVAHESKYKQFINADGEPVVAFDGGYGLTQLTNPKPTYSEAWDWKANIRAGIALYRAKRAEAKQYLSGSKKSPRSYTEDQLELETWCRWNSGRYHEWDETTKSWIRNPNLLNDNKTANIGWDMRKEENKGKSETELHERDKDKYSNPPTKESGWRYSGVVYADHIKD